MLALPPFLAIFEYVAFLYIHFDLGMLLLF